MTILHIICSFKLLHIVMLRINHILLLLIRINISMVWIWQFGKGEMKKVWKLWRTLITYLEMKWIFIFSIVQLYQSMDKLFHIFKWVFKDAIKTLTLHVFPLNNHLVIRSNLLPMEFGFSQVFQHKMTIMFIKTIKHLHMITLCIVLV